MSVSDGGGMQDKGQAGEQSDRNTIFAKEPHKNDRNQDARWQLEARLVPSAES